MKKHLLMLCVTVTLVLAGCAKRNFTEITGVWLVDGTGCIPLDNVQGSTHWPTLRKGTDKAMVINEMKQKVLDMGGNGLALEWYEDGVGQGVALYCPHLDFGAHMGTLERPEIDRDNT